MNGTSRLHEAVAKARDHLALARAAGTHTEPDIQDVLNMLRDRLDLIDRRMEKVERALIHTTGTR